MGSIWDEKFEKRFNEAFESEEDRLSRLYLSVKRVGAKESFRQCIEVTNGVTGKDFMENMKDIMLYAADKQDFITAKEIKDELDNYKTS